MTHASTRISMEICFANFARTQPMEIMANPQCMKNTCNQADPVKQQHRRKGMHNCSTLRMLCHHSLFPAASAQQIKAETAIML